MSDVLKKMRDRSEYQIGQRDDLKREKFFVIRMSKTGTTSITKALEILGLKRITFASVGKLVRGKLTFNCSYGLN